MTFDTGLNGRGALAGRETCHVSNKLDLVHCLKRLNEAEWTAIHKVTSPPRRSSSQKVDLSATCPGMESHLDILHPSGKLVLCFSQRSASSPRVQIAEVPNLFAFIEPILPTELAGKTVTREEREISLDFEVYTTAWTFRTWNLLFSFLYKPSCLSPWST